MEKRKKQHKTQDIRQIVLINSCLDYFIFFVQKECKEGLISLTNVPTLSDATIPNDLSSLGLKNLPERTCDTVCPLPPKEIYPEEINYYHDEHYYERLHAKKWEELSERERYYCLTTFYSHLEYFYTITNPNVKQRFPIFKERHDYADRLSVLVISYLGTYKSSYRLRKKD